MTVIGRLPLVLAAGAVAFGAVAVVLSQPDTRSDDARDAPQAGAPRAPGVAAQPQADPVAVADGDSPDLPRVDPAWVTATAPRAGIAAPALAAYANAALRLADEQPGCRLGWTTLAGIGWVETHHGTIDGNALRADGTTERPILGPALDGSGGVAALTAAPEDTADHGNATWDHAVGPMQFVGRTWRRWGADGDGDGMADRNDVDDAAYAAGRYLCADGYDLTTGPGWTAAVRSYNHSDAYVADVLAAANAYATRAG